MTCAAVQQLQRAAGAVFGTAPLPESFGSVEEEVRAARRTAVLFDLTGTVVLDVTGPDAADYLHRMLTCSVKDLQPEEIRRGTVLRGDGRMIAEVAVRRAANQWFQLLAPSVCRAPLVEHLEKFLIMEDAAIADVTGERAVFEVRGPRAADPDQFVSALLDGTLSLPETGAADTFLLMHGLHRVPAIMVLAPPQAAPLVWSYLARQATAVGGCPAGEHARQILRVEEGVPEFGLDMDGTTIPLEAGLKDTIDFRKGCFPGQEIVARIENLGHPAKCLVGLTFRTAVPPEPGTELFSEGKAVGRITSVADSPTVGARIGLGYVKWDQREAGTELALGTSDSPDRAIVTPRPIVGDFV